MELFQIHTELILTSNKLTLLVTQKYREVYLINSVTFLTAATKFTPVQHKGERKISKYLLLSLKENPWENKYDSFSLCVGF